MRSSLRSDERVKLRAEVFPLTPRVFFDREVLEPPPRRLRPEEEDDVFLANRLSSQPIIA